ncbi:MAG: AI-2E family transporter [Chitinophagaceae bacterium]|nr:AI-2E family transporter [Chitinophagaceae bacterium]
MAQKNESQEYTFTQKVWITTSIVALIVALFWIVKVSFNVLLLLLAGALIAIYFRGLAGLLQRKLNLSPKLSLPLSIVGTLLLFTVFFWFAGSRIQQQVSELRRTLPAATQNFKQKLNNSELGQKILERTSSEGMMKKSGSVLQSFFRSTFGVLGDIYVVLFLGIFFTAAPATYIKGFQKLIPPNGKAKSAEVIKKLGDSLTKWLKGQLFAMFVVFILTAIGLVIIGVPMWLVLAVIAGLLNFIPNFGPLIAMIPAVLVGLMQSPLTALLVAGLYILVQVLESNLITPQIQKKLLDIPPALIIIAQLFMGVLTGGWGLVLATPLMVILIVLVHELYVKKQNYSR